MEEPIKLLCYNPDTNKISEEIVVANFLSDAIDFIKNKYNHNVLVLKVEYNNLEEKLKSLQ